MFSWQDRCCTLSHCNTLYHTIPPHTYRCLVFWRVAPLVTAMHCNRLQHRIPINALCFGELDVAPLATATHCSTLQHTATHCSAVYLLRPCVLASSTSRSERKVCKCGVNVMSECKKRFCSGSYIIYVAVCCGVLQCVVVTKSATEFAKTQGVYSYVALRCVAVCCSVLQ